MTYHSDLAIKLMKLPKVGVVSADKIISKYTDLKIKSYADFFDLVEQSILDKVISKIDKEQIKMCWEEGERSLEKSEKSDVKHLSKFDVDYPQKLKRLKKPPLVLHYKGNIKWLNTSRSCAIIGTREPTTHGYNYGLRASEVLTERQFVIVSGLAKGIDTSGHVGCLNKNGITVAVLAQGIVIEKIYPKENRKLIQEIIEKNGIVISEYPLEQPPNSNLFVERDRIQAGLSDFLFVIETGVTGGTLHTVKFAQESKVPILTYNHPEKYRNEPKAMGNQMLIREKRALGVFDLQDIDAFINNHFGERMDDGKNLSDDGDSATGQHTNPGTQLNIF